jgi:surface carbohydrate biosynthesis protein
MIAPVLYLPVEETKRELTSRLLIACFAAERGITSIIGQQWLLEYNLEHMPPGVVIFKGNDALQTRNMSFARQSGHLTAAFEEEMFGVCTQGQILRLYAPGAAKACNLVLAQGSFQREVLIEHYPEVAERVRIVGNPRADFLSPTFLQIHRAAAEDIAARHGRFILVNTNFGTVNASVGNVFDSFDICARIGLMDAETEQGRADFNAWCAWERLNFGAIVRFVDWIERNLPDLAIVLRPHPSENPDFWRRGYAGHRSVRVEVGGSFIPWLMASTMLVHTGCTTGMEAFMMGRPAVSLTPPGTSWHEHYLSNRINPAFADAVAAGQFIAEELRGGGQIAERRAEAMAELNRHIAISNGKLSAERAVEAMLPLFGSIEPQPWQPAPGFVASIDRHPRQVDKMNASLADISAELLDITRAFGRFERIVARAIGDALYCIDPVIP